MIVLVVPLLIAVPRTRALVRVRNSPPSLAEEARISRLVYANIASLTIRQTTKQRKWNAFVDAPEPGGHGHATVLAADPESSGANSPTWANMCACFFRHSLSHSTGGGEDLSENPGDHCALAVSAPAIGPVNPFPPRAAHVSTSATRPYLGRAGILYLCWGRSSWTIDRVPPRASQSHNGQQHKRRN